MSSLIRRKLSIGDWVTYKTQHKEEYGRVKELRKNGAMVVYNCDNRWEEFANYTAALTPYKDIRKGWPL